MDRLEPSKKSTGGEVEQSGLKTIPTPQSKSKGAVDQPGKRVEHGAFDKNFPR